jgi:murein DD-endopeptidase MepM/ murein hydrolase activator NlpD
MKDKSSDHYSILFVPRNSSSIKRFELTSRFFAGTLAIVLLLGATFVWVSAQFIHYRKAYLETETARLEIAQFQRKKASLVAQLKSLEGAVGRTDRFAAKLDNTDQSSSGQGPIEKGDWLPDDKLAQVVKTDAAKWRSPFVSVPTKDINSRVKTLQADVLSAEANVHKAFAVKQEQILPWMSLPTSWPSRGWVTSKFGERRKWRNGRSRWHEGIDIAAPRGTEIYAPADGIVTFAGYRSGYGRTVMIDHGFGMTTLYGHCSKVIASEGMYIKKGMLVGTIGNTGRSTGPHLHYEVLINGVAVDPVLYIAERI